MPNNIANRVAVAMLIGALFAAAPASALTARFTGAGDDWFDPANWSTGAVPDASTDVVIAGGANVVLDPARGTRTVTVQDLMILDESSLTTRAGTVITTRDEFLGGTARLVHESTESYGRDFTAGTRSLRCFGCTIKFNPTPKSRRNVLLQSSFTSSFGLGGALASGPGRVGAGYYATLTAEDIAIAGRLLLPLYYGFTPTAGDSYQIIAATTARGEFRARPEGATAAHYGNVDLRISYRGGDGNDVVLNAVAVPEATSAGLLGAALALGGWARLRRR